MLLAIASLTLGTPRLAEAQTTSNAKSEAKPSQLPRTLRDGAPQQRFSAKAGARSSPQAPPRATPAPSIEIDPHDLLPRASSERRSEMMLLREIDLLKRVVRHSRLDDRRADALLRLAYALQELMWLQNVRVHQLHDAHGSDCRCTAGSAEAVATAAPASAADRAPLICSLELARPRS
ncbi:MAG TPA: hypothetical protein VK509_17560 [Polyangiales bacterium]|nr:hypothetical protein [Polyangiales bacterium]